MKLLVVGPTGQLGRDLMATATTRAGVEPTPLARGRLDLARPDAIPDALADTPFDALVNCAAYTAVDDAESDRDAAFTLNAHVPEALAAACRRAGARLLHVSTDYVFDGESDRPYVPEDAPHPLNVYGASKIEGERLARSVHPEGTIVVRTSALFGASGAAGGPGHNFVETMIRAGRERESVRVVADVVTAPTFTADLAGAILDLLERGEPGIYHVTNAGRASWHDFATAIFERADAPARLDAVPASDYPTPARRPRFSVLDTAATDRLIGPLPDWSDALDRYLAGRPVALSGE